MKHKIFLLLLCLTAFYAQAQQSTFSERAFRIGNTGRTFMCTTLTPQGNLLLSGTIAKSAIWEQVMFYTLKPNLDTLWSRKGPKTSMLAQGLAPTPNGGYIFAGTTEVPVVNDYSDDKLLHKIDANGHPVWSQTYSGVPVYGDDRNYALLTMPDKGYLMGGFGGILNKQVWYSVMRTDSLGNVRWRRSYDWTNRDLFAAMCLTKNGNILTAGTLRDFTQIDHLKLLLIDPNGDSLKSNILNVNGINRREILSSGSRSLLSLSDGGFLVNAWVDTTINGGGCLLGMLVKVNSNLQQVWKHVYRPFNTPWRDFQGAQELADGSIVVAGTDQYNSTQPATNNVYLHHVSAQGLPINVYTFPSAYSYVFINTMQAMPDSSFILGGTCYTAANDRGFYAAKIKIPGLPKVISGLPTESFAQSIELGQSYPNPTSETAIIPYTLPIKYKQAKILIRDITGREVGKYNLKPKTSSLEVNLNNLNNGLYTYTLLLDEKPIATKKLAVLK